MWESDVVHAGFLQRGLEVLENSRYTHRPTEGKYAGALVMDVSSFLPGLEEPNVVLVRSDGNAMYVAKDIGYQFWKAGLFEGLGFERFAVQPSGALLYTSSPDGEPHPDGRTFAGADEIINVIDVRQSHPQTIVRTALPWPTTRAPRGRTGTPTTWRTRSSRRGPADERPQGHHALDRRGHRRGDAPSAPSSRRRTPTSPAATTSPRPGIGALRFAMLRSEAKKVIDFRWEQALSCRATRRRTSSTRTPAPAASSGRGDGRLTPETARAGADFGALGRLEVGLAQVLARYRA